MLRQLIPLALSINTIALMWLVGNKRVLGWILAVAGQGGWFLFVFVFKAWGLLPMVLALTFVYVRNLLKWRKERKVIDDTNRTTADRPEGYQDRGHDSLAGEAS